LGAEVGVSPLGGGGREHRARPERGRRKAATASRPRYLRDKRWRDVPARANGQLAFGNYRWDEQREAFELSVLTEGIAEITTFLGAELPLRFGLPDEL
jgi:hypothetical protein